MQPPPLEEQAKGEKMYTELVATVDEMPQQEQCRSLVSVAPSKVGMLTIVEGRHHLDCQIKVALHFREKEKKKM